nr:MAG TPA: hypothetical protein [Caudoviricetes sp.]
MAIRDDGRPTTQVQKEAVGQSFGGQPKQNKEKPNTDSKLDPSVVAKRLDDNAGLTDNEKDGLKYQTAVNMARQHFANEEDVDNKRLREYIDEQYALMNPTLSGSEMRGENVVGNLIRDASEGWKGLMNGIGTGIDSAWDTAVGGGLDALGWKDAANTARDMATGRDIGTGLDIATDIGLVFIPGVGPALAVGKAAADNMGDFDEFAKGYDSITLEKLSDEQRAAKGLGAVANTALAALPGAGKIAGGIRGIAGTKKAAQAGIDTARDALQAASKEGAALAKAEGKTGQEAIDAIKSMTEPETKALAEAMLKGDDAVKALGSKESFQEAGQVAKQNLTDGTYAQRIKDAYSAPDQNFLQRMSSGIKAANPRTNLLTDATGAYKGPMRSMNENMTARTAEKGLKEIALNAEKAAARSGEATAQKAATEAAASKAAKGAAAADEAIAKAGGKGIKGAISNVKDAAKSAPRKLGDRLPITNTGGKKGLRRAAELAGTFAGNTALGALNYQGEYGGNIGQNILRYYSDLASHPSALAGMAMAPGSAKMGSRLGGLRGYKTPSRVPQNAMRIGSGGIVAKDMLGADTGQGITDEEQLDNLDQLAQYFASLKQGGGR